MNTVQLENGRLLLQRIGGLNDSLIAPVDYNLMAVGLTIWAIVVIVLLGCLLLVFIAFLFIKKVKFRCCNQNISKFLVVLIVATLSIGVSFAVYLEPKINAAINLSPTTCTIFNKAEAEYITAGTTLYRLELNVTYINNGVTINAVAYDDPIGAFTPGDKTSELNELNGNCSCYYSKTNPHFAALTNISPLDKVLIGVTLPISFVLLIIEFYFCGRQCRKGNKNENQGNEDDNIFKAQELGDKNNNDGREKAAHQDNVNTLDKLRTL